MTPYTRSWGEPDAPYENPLFDGSGDFDENWDVWEEIRDIISADQLQELAEDAAGFPAYFTFCCSSFTVSCSFFSSSFSDSMASAVPSS